MAKFRQKAILSKLESSYGVDPEPSGAANAILAKDLEIEPMAGETEQRNLIRPYSGNDEAIPVGVHVSMRFRVEMAGAGTKGAVPGYDPLLQACGFAQTVTEDTMVEYDPVSADEESVTHYLHQNGTLHKARGSRGSVGILIEPKRIPHFMFDFRGLFTTIAAASLPEVDYSDFMTPIPAGKVNTPTFSLHGFSGRLERCEISLNNDVQYRELVGYEGVEIVDRAPSGTLLIEAPAIGTKDFFGIARSAALGALQIVHGTADGHIVQIDAPKVQIGQPSYQESQGITMLSLPITLVPDEGDDELKITVK